MTDLWILAFVVRGVIAAAGDPMPLEQCKWRSQDLGPGFSGVVCINVSDPSCRIYRGQLYTERTRKCIERLREPSKAAAKGNA
ncbi:hypothetical protein N5K37_14620 [Delftia tsuruhatensis]|uniref:Secreted protein n=1 Tax=Delftia tsuruhatensis TaxID=180282 RepID=A0ABN4SR90_9BURK|nr:hypothetical protein [Delftia tsuruhatensis]AOV05688.1 hypothetical protein BI380_32450 [Delftia tsuruhatensis]MDH2231144.1 hypothetical protein [Delftia tsuruhatensis]